LKLIPAIDLLGGKVVRLFRGDYQEVTEYRLDPAEVLKDFYQAGARLVHIVDLNAARSGDRKTNEAVISELARGGVDLELGGGLRSMEDLTTVFSMGVKRAILGTAAARDPVFLEQALLEYGPDRIVVGVDVLGDRVRISGWEEDSGRSLWEFLHDIENRGIREIIFTEISRDGAMSGPPLEVIKNILERTTLAVIASGGVSSLSDLEQIKKLRHERLLGVISGRALYEGKLDLASGIQILAE